MRDIYLDGQGQVDQDRERERGIGIGGVGEKKRGAEGVVMGSQSRRVFREKQGVMRSYRKREKKVLRGWGSDTGTGVKCRCSGRGGRVRDGAIKVQGGQGEER